MMEMSANRFIITYRWRDKNYHTTIYALDKKNAIDLFNKSAPSAQIERCYPRPFKAPRKAQPQQQALYPTLTKPTT